MAILVKTGVTEVLARLPQQLVTLAECVPEFIIFSDLEEDIGRFHLYDALVDRGAVWKEMHEDFTSHNEVHNTFERRGDLSVVRTSSSGGEQLDK